MTQEQQQLQRAAFIMAEYDHKNDEGIKEQAAKVQTLRERVFKLKMLK